ncbi:MAG: hypothetical protein J6C25_09190 [Treponema sp.]|nr:hypothetical protein [Treponema sp.]
MNNNDYNPKRPIKQIGKDADTLKDGKREAGLYLTIGGTTALWLLISSLGKTWWFLIWLGANPIHIANPALFGSAIGIICIATLFTITRVIFCQRSIIRGLENYSPQGREEYARIIFGQIVYLISRLDLQEQEQYRNYLLTRLHKMLGFDKEEANKILDNFFNKKIEELIVEIEKKPSEELDRDSVILLKMNSVKELNDIKNEIIGTDKKTKIKVDKILKEINQIYLKGIKIEDINLSSKTQGLKLLYVLKLLTDQSDMFEDASEIKRNYLYSLDIKDDSISKELCEKKRVRDYEIKLYLKMLTVPNENKDLILKEVKEELTNVANQYQINKESKKNNNKRYIAKTIDKLKKMI